MNQLGTLGMDNSESPLGTRTSPGGRGGDRDRDRDLGERGGERGGERRPRTFGVVVGREMVEVRVMARARVRAKPKGEG